jgi:hypothetical protein
MRFDTAQLLKRFFFCERSLLVSMAAWIPSIASLDIKIEMARFIWQSSETANALRERVFELRFPSRLLEEEGSDHSLIGLIGSVRDSPSVPALLSAVGHVFLPALRGAYRDYIYASDPLADGPTHRFLSVALTEKQEQVDAFQKWAATSLTQNAALRESTAAWTHDLSQRLRAIGGIGVGPASQVDVTTPQTNTYTIPDRPARDPRFWPCRFYWPDIVDSTFPYGEGLRLQLRSAISHERSLGDRGWRNHSELICRCFPGNGFATRLAGRTTSHDIAEWGTNA